MMSQIGFMAEGVALVVALATLLVAVKAGREGSRGLMGLASLGVMLTFASVAIASASLLHAFVHSDFSLKVVYQYSDAEMPALYKVAAFWGGQPGSLLFWALALTGFSALMTHTLRHRRGPLVAWAQAILMAVSVFFLMLLVFVTDPFETFYIMSPPADGQGLNPLLQNVWMAIHPPVLLIGFAGFTVPFALGMAALIARDTSGAWHRLSRPWTLVSWAFLGLGSLLGARWAYLELGWGGYWAWDPVENAALMPWLTATAFLHTSMATRRRGILGRWSIVLLAVTFWLTLFGTFLTRSGLIASVHAFARSPIGLYFLVFLAIVAVAVTSLLALRWRSLEPDRTTGGAKGGLPLTSPMLATVVFMLALGTLGFIRGALVLLAWLVVTRVAVGKGGRKDPALPVTKDQAVWLTAIVLGALTFGVMWGTLLPTLSQWLSSTRRQVSTGWFSELAATGGLILLVLLVTCSLVAWQQRGRRPMRGDLVAVMAGTGALVAVALIGMALTRGSLRFAEIDRLWLPQAVLVVLLAALLVSVIAVDLARDARAWRQRSAGSSGEVVRTVIARQRRKYGAQVSHLGIALFMFSLSGNTMREHQLIELARGESTTVAGYLMTYRGIEIEEHRSHLAVMADLLISWCGETAGAPDPSSCSRPFVLRPARFDYNDHRPGVPPDPGRVTSEIAVRSTPVEDVYVALGGFTAGGEVASFEVHVNPLVFWLWWGGALAVAGALLSLWPEARPRSKGIASPGVAT